MKKRLTILKSRNVIYTGILLLFLTIGTSIAAASINTREKEYFFDILLKTSQSLSMDITSHIYTNQTQLEVIAQIIAGYDSLDSEEVKTLLASYEARNIMSHLEILLPDNSVMLRDGSIVDAGEILSFDRELAKGIHITDAEPDIINRSDKVLRNYVPIIKDGETIALLYGVTFLSDLPDLWTIDAFDGNCYIYVLNGITGDLIVDTWHQSQDNIQNMGTFELKKGFSEDKLIEDLAKGNSGHIIFRSLASNKDLYFYYEPLPINDWRICISVSEDVVYRNVSIVKNILAPFIIFEIVCFVCYIVLLLRQAKKETYEKQQRLEAVSYIHDVEKYLFTAHLQKENISLALQRIAQMTSAQAAFFISYEQEKEVTYTFCSDESPQDSYYTVLENHSVLTDYFAHGYEYLLLYDAETIRRALGRRTLTENTETPQNIMAVPIKDIEDNMVGLLSVMNMSHQWDNVALLSNVALSFSMLYNNMQTYSTIKELGEKDLLTGLLNRNSYEEHLPQYKDCFHESLSCIYIDVNGLHELNNSKGHGAGDRMLQYIGHAVQDQFGIDHTFRIGGDEFVAFAIDESEDTISEKVAAIKVLLQMQNYHASFGINYSRSVNSIEEFIKTAEQKMYTEKKLYYQENPCERH